MKELLAIDIGNSNVKYALFVNGRVKETWRHPTATVATDAAAILNSSSCRVAISSVVPAAEQHLRSLLSNRDVISIGEICQNLLTGMDRSMGADRVADAVAAWMLHGKGRTPVAVIGMGTATTMLVVSGSGHVKGGWIAPGLSVTLESLHQRTALLPLLKMEGQNLVLGYDTATHMRNGVFTGHIGLVREWLSVAKNNLSGQALTIGTGGWSKSVQEFGKVFDVVDPDLTLKGIYLLATHSNNPPEVASAHQVALAKKSFARLMAELGVSEEKWTSIWHRLETLYSERKRYYHNLKHINKVLYWLRQFSSGSPSALVRLAAFYHDAIYDTRESDNEDKSALMAIADMRELGLPEQLGQDVAALIRATKGHKPLAGRLARESRIFLDADLSILGAAPSEYGRYAANIALEYDWFEPEAYRKGRSGVLKRFVERKQIFYTQKAISALDKSARSNLAREFKQLRRSPKISSQ